jgi:hypothetical protein
VKPMVLESAQVDKLVYISNTKTSEVVPGTEEDDRVRPSSHQASTRVEQGLNKTYMILYVHVHIIHAYPRYMKNQEGEFKRNHTHIYI